MSKVRDEMLKFFDAVSGGSGPYGWIYAAEYEKYGIDFAEHEPKESFRHGIQFLTLRVYGRYIVIYYEEDKNMFYINSLSYRTLCCETLEELFNLLLSTYGN